MPGNPRSSRPFPPASSTARRPWRTRRKWDVLVVGGGVHGASIARDAASRGLTTLLVEQRDFASGTSSRSSKLAHGGLRYLEHLEVGLVRESLRERDALLRAAPHLSWPLPFLIPLSGPRPRAGWKVRVGLSLYDLLSGGSSLGHHDVIDAAKAVELAPALAGCGMDTAARYHDAGMDDARIVVELVLDAQALGATCLNHVKATGLLRARGRILGASVEDASGRRTDVHATVTVLAAGPWTDALADRRKDGSRRLALTKGAHVFLARPLVKEAALMLAAPQDGRIFFVIPWKGGSLIGTTDTAYRRPADDVRPAPADVKYLIAAVNETLPEARIQRSEIIAAQAGLRPLVAPERRGAPSSISRDYRLDTGPDGLIVVEGGKYTIFRKLAERVVDEAIEDIVALEPSRAFSPCVTDTRILPGAATAWPAFRDKEVARLTSKRLPADAAARLVGRYGARAKEVVAAAGREAWLLRPACDEHPHLPAEAVHAVRAETASQPADALLRRLDLGWTACGGVRCRETWERAFRESGMRAQAIKTGMDAHERELSRDWRG